MTHKELLAKINELSNYFSYEPCEEFESALRAVVELHKPEDKYFPKKVYGSDGYLDMGGETKTRCYACDFAYPCPTIQAIEKELK